MWKAFQKEKFKYALSFASILRRQKKITYFFFFSPHRELSCSIPVFADTMTNVKELQIKQVFTAQLHSVRTIPISLPQVHVELQPLPVQQPPHLLFVKFCK